jgi:excisionase family DNA binding protein|tara:strand:+ start:500 stop:724 length:225 start_codon:yes stop_codon:yes gene_type:complete
MSEKECPCCLCDEHRFMTRKEVADHLGVSVLTVITYVKDETLPEYLVGAKSVRYKVSDVNALIQKRTTVKARST